MTEILLSERIALERQRDSDARLDRINSVEKAIAVLNVRFDAALERAVHGEDLSNLKREMEAHVKEAIAQVCEHLSRENTRQSGDILARVETMLASVATQAKDEQLAQKEALLRAISERRSHWMWWVLGIVGGLVTTIIGAVITVEMLGYH